MTRTLDDALAQIDSLEKLLGSLEGQVAGLPDGEHLSAGELSRVRAMMSNMSDDDMEMMINVARERRERIAAEKFFIRTGERAKKFGIAIMAVGTVYMAFKDAIHAFIKGMG